MKYLYKYNFILYVIYKNKSIKKLTMHNFLNFFFYFFISGKRYTFLSFLFDRQTLQYHAMALHGLLLVKADMEKVETY